LDDLSKIFEFKENQTAFKKENKNQSNLDYFIEFNIDKISRKLKFVFKYDYFGECLLNDEVETSLFFFIRYRKEIDREANKIVP
jgi:hypothetical protein